MTSKFTLKRFYLFLFNIQYFHKLRSFHSLKVYVVVIEL